MTLKSNVTKDVAQYKYLCHSGLNFAATSSALLVAISLHSLSPSSTQLKLGKISMDTTAIAQSQNAPHEPSYHPLSLSELQEKYQALYHKLRGSDVSYKMYQTFYDKLSLLPDIEMTNCVCLGLGSLTGLEEQRLSVEDVEKREDSLHQLVVLTMILDTDLLGARHAVRDVWLQDPEFSETDHIFLESLGFTVIQHPKALEKITSNTFVSAPRVHPIIIAMVFITCHPALYIGNCLDRWIEMLSPDDAFPVLETLTCYQDASRLVLFPVLEDSPYSWTRVTGIYWLRKEGEGWAPAEHLRWMASIFQGYFAQFCRWKWTPLQGYPDAVVEEEICDSCRDQGGIGM